MWAHGDMGALPSQGIDALTCSGHSFSGYTLCRKPLPSKFQSGSFAATTRRLQSAAMLMGTLPSMVSDIGFAGTTPESQYSQQVDPMARRPAVPGCVVGPWSGRAASG